MNQSQITTLHSTLIYNLQYSSLRYLFKSFDYFNNQNAITSTYQNNESELHNNETH